MATEHIPWASYPTATCPKKCRYLDNHHICNYYLITGQRRPCPAGAGCTVADAGRKLRPWEIPIVANDGALGEDWGENKETGYKKPGKPRVQWDTEEGRRLREQGLFNREIAERLGVSESVVSAWAREHCRISRYPAGAAGTPRRAGGFGSRASAAPRSQSAWACPT